MKIMISTLIDIHVKAWMDRCNTIYGTNNNDDNNVKEDLLYAIKIYYKRHDYLSHEDHKWFGKSIEDFHTMTVHNICFWIRIAKKLIENNNKCQNKMNIYNIKFNSN